MPLHHLRHQTVLQHLTQRETQWKLGKGNSRPQTVKLHKPNQKKRTWNHTTRSWPPETCCFEANASDKAPIQNCSLSCSSVSSASTFSKLWAFSVALGALSGSQTSSCEPNHPYSASVVQQKSADPVGLPAKAMVPLSATHYELWTIYILDILYFIFSILYLYYIFIYIIYIYIYIYILLYSFYSLLYTDIYIYIYIYIIYIYSYSLFYTDIHYYYIVHYYYIWFIAF